MAVSYKTTFNEPTIIPTGDRRLFLMGFSWPLLFGGFFVSLLAYWVFVSLGIGLGSFGLQVDQITGDTLQALSIGALSWVAVSCALALGIGAYACTRFSATGSMKNGIFQSMVISSLFFALMAVQATSVLVPMASQSIGALGSASTTLAAQPRVQSFFEDSMNGLELRGVERDALIKSIGTRLMTNDSTSLRGLLAQHSTMSAPEVDARATELEANFKRVSTEVANGVGKALAFSGLVLFGILIIGSLGALIGGSMAARANIKSQAVRV